MDGIYVYNKNKPQNIVLFHEVLTNYLITSVWTNQMVTLFCSLSVSNNRLKIRAWYGVNGDDSFSVDGDIVRFEDNLMPDGSNPPNNYTDRSNTNLHFNAQVRITNLGVTRTFNTPGRMEIFQFGYDRNDCLVWDLIMDNGKDRFGVPDVTRLANKPVLTVISSKRNQDAMIGTYQQIFTKADQVQCFQPDTNLPATCIANKNAIDSSSINASLSAATQQMQTTQSLIDGLTDTQNKGIACKDRYKALQDQQAKYTADISPVQTALTAINQNVQTIGSKLAQLQQSLTAEQTKNSELLSAQQDLQMRIDNAIRQQPIADQQLKDLTAKKDSILRDLSAAVAAANQLQTQLTTTQQKVSDPVAAAYITSAQTTVQLTKELAALQEQLKQQGLKSDNIKEALRLHAGIQDLQVQLNGDLQVIGIQSASMFGTNADLMMLALLVVLVIVVIVAIIKKRAPVESKEETNFKNHK